MPQQHEGQAISVLPPSLPAPRPSLPDPMSSLPGFCTGLSLSATSAPINWLWHGYLAPGSVTVLTSQWKSGKTSLLAALVSRMAKGGTLAGLDVRRGRAVVISEESHLHWYQRSRILPFEDNVALLCRPFTGKPTLAEWSSLVDKLVKVHRDQPLDQLAIDPLANFLPGHNENLAAGLVETLMTLQPLTSLGISVLILHHPRKGETRAGQAARGSGALGAYADILLEMRWFARPTDPDRRRVIEAFSRYDATPKRLVIERTADGTDYISLGDLAEHDADSGRRIIEEILTAADAPLTRKEILRHWPHDIKKPDDTTLWRWLEKLVAEAQIVQSQSGRKNDPFRYQWPE